MRTEPVEYYSQGDLVRALWRTPGEPRGALPAVIQGPGWLGLKDAAVYDAYHELLTGAGFGVLSIDYRGFGESEGPRGAVSPDRQVEDLVNGVTYLTTRPDVDAEAVGAFGTGGTGGGNVVLLGAADARVRALVSQFPVADGADWLRRMRPEHEWVSLKHALAEDRRERVLTGKSRLVDPAGEIVLPTPERARSGFKADVDRRVPTQVPFETVDNLLRYRPVDAARGLTTPLLLIAVEDDATTPAHHAEAIFDAVAGPRRLLVQRHTSHYAAYQQYAHVVMPQIADWFRTHLHGPGEVVVRDAGTPAAPGRPADERRRD